MQLNKSYCSTWLDRDFALETFLDVIDFFFWDLLRLELGVFWLSSWNKFRFASKDDSNFLFEDFLFCQRLTIFSSPSSCHYFCWPRIPFSFIFKNDIQLIMVLLGSLSFLTSFSAVLLFICNPLTVGGSEAHYMTLSTILSYTSLTEDICTGFWTAHKPFTVRWSVF